MSRGVLRTAGMPSVAKSMTCSALTMKLSWPTVPVAGRDFMEERVPWCVVREAGRVVPLRAASTVPPREAPLIIGQPLGGVHGREVGRAVGMFGPGPERGAIRN